MNGYPSNSQKIQFIDINNVNQADGSITGPLIEGYPSDTSRVIPMDSTGHQVTLLFSGQAANGPSGPTSTVNHGVAIWSGTTGQALLNSPVEINPVNGDISTSGTIFLNAPVTANIQAGGNISISSTGGGKAVGLASLGAAGIVAAQGIFLISASGITTGGNIAPQASGVDNLGSPSLPYSGIYAKSMTFNDTLSTISAPNLDVLASGSMLVGSTQGSVSILSHTSIFLGAQSFVSLTGDFLPSFSGTQNIGSQTVPFSGVVARSFITQSPNGNYWRLVVDNAGVVSGVSFP